jgi:hypothetical protein
MKIGLAAAVCATMFAARAVLASDMQPCQTFMNSDGRFDVGKAYADSVLVVIGRVLPKTQNRLFIVRKIKGAESRKDVSLTIPRCAGTSCGGGFSVAPNVELLFLLKEAPGGLYDGVSGNGNFSCPTVFEVKKGFVEIGPAKVPLARLKRYLEEKPDPI